MSSKMEVDIPERKAMDLKVLQKQLKKRKLAASSSSSPRHSPKRIKGGDEKVCVALCTLTALPIKYETAPLEWNIFLIDETGRVQRKVVTAAELPSEDVAFPTAIEVKNNGTNLKEVGKIKWLVEQKFTAKAFRLPRGLVLAFGQKKDETNDLPVSCSSPPVSSSSMPLYMYLRHLATRKYWGDTNKLRTRDFHPSVIETRMTPAALEAWHTFELETRKTLLSEFVNREEFAQLMAE